MRHLVFFALEPQWRQAGVPDQTSRRSAVTGFPRWGATLSLTRDLIPTDSPLKSHIFRDRVAKQKSEDPTKEKLL